MKPIVSGYTGFSCCTKKETKCCKQLCSQGDINSPNITGTIPSGTMRVIYEAIPDNIGKTGMLTFHNIPNGGNGPINLTLVPHVGPSPPDITINPGEIQSISFEDLIRIQASTIEEFSGEYSYQICTLLDAKDNCCEILCSQTDPVLSTQIEPNQMQPDIIYQNSPNNIGKTGMISLRGVSELITLNFELQTGVTIPIMVNSDQGITVPFEDVVEINVNNASDEVVNLVYTICTLLGSNKSK
ncbi:hypothetical protein V1503_09410 [Bacillus sp. SCS-151]|uniref:hypothetical protein n=1 Tax=Nanhaiella sioensis TaxID=3115293 RepID=UPI00397A0282